MSDNSKKLGEDLLNAWQGVYSSFASNPEVFKTMVAFTRNLSESVNRNGTQGQDKNCENAASASESSGVDGINYMEQLLERLAKIESRLAKLEEHAGNAGKERTSRGSGKSRPSGTTKKSLPRSKRSDK